MDPTFIKKAEEIAALLVQYGPGALRALANLLKLFPAKTLAYKLGDLILHFES
jgi:hypothetical protein